MSGARRGSGARRNPAQTTGEPLVTEVAWLYYHDGLNQRAIAERLGVSRASVVNYLALARDAGIVRIALDPAAFAATAEARALTDALGLAAAYVVPDGNAHGNAHGGASGGACAETLFARTARAAADWLPDLLAPGDRLGLAWGRTMFEMAGLVERRAMPDVTVLQLVGSMATPYGFTAEACSTRLAQRLGAACVNLHAPAILGDPALARALREEPILRAQLDAVSRPTKAILSAGTCDEDSHIVRAGLATPAELRGYVARGAVGVICGRFVDADGRAVDGPLEARMIGAPLSCLSGLEACILAVPGHDKVPASLAAIRGGAVTHVVAGASVARALVAAA